MAFEEKRNLSAKGSIVLYLFIILFFVCVIFVYYRMLSSETKENIISTGKTSAIDSADQINRQLSSNIDMLKLSAYTVEGMLRDGRSIVEIRDYLVNESTAISEALDDNTNGLYGYISGAFVSGIGWVPDAHYKPTERPWYLLGMEGRGEIVIADPHTDILSGESMISISKALSDGQSVLSIDVSLENLQTITEKHISENLSCNEYIISGGGQILAHSDKSHVGMQLADSSNPFEAAIAEKMSDSTDSFFYLKFDDKDYLVYLMPLEYDWTCISVIDATEDVRRLRWPLVVTVLTAIDVVGIMTFYIVQMNRKSREANRFALQSARATAASEAKTSFLSNMSHEIRTPINAILGMNEMILREAKDVNILSYAENVRAAGSTLLGLINDVLDFSKIEAGKIEILPVDYDLSSVISDLVNMIRTRAEDKGLSLILEIDRNIPNLLRGDEVRVKQVITNILTNAVKYTDEGSVTFAVGFETNEKDSDAILLHVAVRDTGIGIRKEDMEKLFGEFERINEERIHIIEGTGLGMSITGSLLELMGSSLQVESVYGKGSEFSFALRQEVAGWEPIGDPNDSGHAAERRHSAYREKLTAPEARVLVVDDNEINLEVFVSLIKQTLMQADTAESGDEAILLANENCYDLIFLDHMMPGKDGIATLHEIRSRLVCPNYLTPAICLTANAISGAREQYIAEGFDDYLTKPIDSARLEELLIAYLPEDKVIRTAAALTEDEMSSLPEWMTALPENLIDIGAGLAANGRNAASYESVLKIFSDSTAAKLEEINSYYEKENYGDYTIKVHAFKSSARVIGASALGGLAQQLEDAGKTGQIDYIRGHHAEFVAEAWRVVAPLSEHFAPDETLEDSRPDAPAGMFSRIAVRLRQAADDMDSDTIDSLLGELAPYRLPKDNAALYRKLTAAAEEFDYDGILALLEDYQ